MATKKIASVNTSFLKATATRNPLYYTSCRLTTTAIYTSGCLKPTASVIQRICTSGNLKKTAGRDLSPLALHSRGPFVLFPLALVLYEPPIEKILSTDKNHFCTSIYLIFLSIESRVQIVGICLAQIDTLQLFKINLKAHSYMHVEVGELQSHLAS